MAVTVLRVRGDRAGSALPYKAHDDDAGFDLFTYGEHLINPGEFADVDCGISVQLPEGYWGMLTGRSSTIRRRGLLINQGVIDTGYRGPLYAGCWNLTRDPVKVGPGERLAQLILIPTGVGRFDRFEAHWVHRLDDHPRGGNGFGSTGS